MNVTSTGKSGLKLERPYLCVSEGAIWLAETIDGYVCVDPLDSNKGIGEYEESLEEVVLFDGKVTLSN